jgi:serine kinase of HPr protein (carbohydrate metabolism regulator)
MNYTKNRLVIPASDRLHAQEIADRIWGLCVPTTGRSMVEIRGLGSEVVASMDPADTVVILESMIKEGFFD